MACVSKFTIVYQTTLLALTTIIFKNLILFFNYTVEPVYNGLTIGTMLSGCYTEVACL